MNNVIIFPTDTVYGIGTKITDKEGVNLIYQIKKRPKDKPLAVLCANLAQIKSICIVDARAEKIINAFLPGPLTLILNSTKDGYSVTGLKTIGVRIPNLKEAITILEENGPMFTTSVNDSGSPSLDDYEVIKEKYGKMVSKIYPKQHASSHVPSSVLDLTKPDLVMLRQGAITLEEIQKCL